MKQKAGFFVKVSLYVDLTIYHNLSDSATFVSDKQKSWSALTMTLSGQSEKHFWFQATSNTLIKANQSM